MIYISIVLFALGIIFEEIFIIGWSVGIFVGFLTLAVYLVLQKEKKYWAKVVLIVGLSFCIGFIRLSLVDISPDQSLIQKVGEKISLTTRIAEEPDRRDVSVRYVVSSHESKSKILLVANRFPEFQYGDKIKVEGKLALPKNFVGDMGVEFDYISYLSKDNIHFIIYQPQINLLESSKAGLFASLYQLKNIFIAKISNVVPEPNASLLSGMLFGAKQSLGIDLLDQFKNVGLIHIVVLSGYNITIIAWAILSFTYYFGKRNLGLFISVLGIILFSIMVGLGATVIRAGIMALIAILARYLGRPADALRWLFIAGFLMLLYNPLSLLRDPSFQLSFMATLGLIIFTPFVYQILSKKFSFISERFALREIISSTIAVQIFILPLLIKMSGIVSLISFIINPFILPFTPLLMALGGLTGGAGLISYFLSWPFGTLSYLLTEFVIRTVELSASLPLATLPVGQISLWLIIIWYLFYGFIYFKLKSKGVSPHPASGHPPLD